jgi:hypothetical protein
MSSIHLTSSSTKGVPYRTNCDEDISNITRDGMRCLSVDVPYKFSWDGSSNLAKRIKEPDWSGCSGMLDGAVRKGRDHSLAPEKANGMSLALGSLTFWGMVRFCQRDPWVWGKGLVEDYGSSIFVGKNGTNSTLPLRPTTTQDSDSSRLLLGTLTVLLVTISCKPFPRLFHQFSSDSSKAMWRWEIWSIDFTFCLFDSLYIEFSLYIGRVLNHLPVLTGKFVGWSSFLSEISWFVTISQFVAKSARVHSSGVAKVVSHDG